MHLKQIRFGLPALAGVLLLFAACDWPWNSLPETEEEARAQYGRLVKELPDKPSDPALYDEWCNARLYLRKIDFLLSAREAGAGWLAEAGVELQNARRAGARVRAGKPPKLIKGWREEGYYADNDDSFQPFWRYLPKSYQPGKKHPLVVFLHGYAPTMTILGYRGVPQCLIDLADQEGWVIAQPFGRSNTDYQGIGEQDVLRVIAEMKRRYAVDEDRVVLTGHSMGGTGVWHVGARRPDLFAALVPVAGRGDYYTWQNLPRDSLPSYKRRLVEVEFAGSQPERLARSNILCVHGEWDDVVLVQEARYMVNAVRPFNPGLRYVEVPQGGHGNYDEIVGSPEARAWLLACRRPTEPVPPVREPVSVKTAFLSPFIFVFSGSPALREHRERYEQAVTDWYRYAKAQPRMAVEKSLAYDQLKAHNIFLFGEPETSPLIRQVLAYSPVKVTATSYVIGTRACPRAGNGLYMIRPNPWNPAKFVVIQCGERWGAGLWENHKYDFLPGYIVYTAQTDDDGSNTALAAGFFDEAGRLAE